MREQVNGIQKNSIGQTGDTISPGIQNSHYVHDPMFSAGHNNRNQYDMSKINVMWTSWDAGAGGIDDVFGFDDDPFEGPTW